MRPTCFITKQSSRFPGMCHLFFSHTVSYNFWFSPRQTSKYMKVNAPEKTNDKMANNKKPGASWIPLGLTRKLEKMIAETLQDPSAVSSVPQASKRVKKPHKLHSF